MAAMDQENLPPAAAGDENAAPSADGALSWLSKERQDAAAESRTVHEQAVAAGGAGLAEAWDRYLAWAEAHPEGTADAHSASLKGLLLRCVTALASSRERDGDGMLHRNALRSLIIVITHVDGCRDADAFAVFEQMYREGLGLRFSLLYEGWAVVLERQKNFDAAEKIFDLGIDSAAKRQVEEGFEATLRKAQRDLVRRRRKRAGGAGAQAGGGAAKKARKRVEKPGYVRELLANDDGEELCFEEVRLLRYNIKPADPEPEVSPAPPSSTADGPIGSLIPSPQPAANPSPVAAAASPEEAAAAPPAAAITPTRSYGAESDALTARAVFTCLQLPPEDMEGDIVLLIDAINDDAAHARSLRESLLVDARLELVCGEILQKARAFRGTLCGGALLYLLNSVATLVEAASDGGQPFAAPTGPPAAPILGHLEHFMSAGASEALDEEDALQLLQGVGRLVRLGAARASAPDTASLLRCLLDYVVNPFEESCVAACRLVLALHRAAQDAVPPLAAMLQQHANVRPLGETLVRAFNHSLAAELSPCLAALAALFSSPTSADFFYPNDQKVIIDVLVRELDNIPPTAELRKGFLQVVRGVVTHSADYRTHRHRQEHLIAALKKIAETASETVDNAARGGARDLCVELGGSCDYTGRLGVDY